MALFNGKNYLSKKYMGDKFYNYDRDYVYANKKNFVEFLNLIEEEFYSHTFNKDDRYVFLGRHKFLIKEMQELYFTKEQCEKLQFNICPAIWCLDSLIEMVVKPNFLSISDYEDLKDCNSIYLNRDVRKCQEIYNSYISEGIISLNERDYIMHAINMIKDSLDKYDDNMKWID